MSDGQARRLWDRAGALRPARRPDRGDRLLPRALDDRAGRRGAAGSGGRRHRPARRQRPRSPAVGGHRDEGEADHDAFLANLAARRGRRPGPPRAPFLAATRSTTVDGRRRPALRRRRAPLRAGRATTSTAGARGCAPGGTLLIHDAFSSVGVTLAIGRHLLIGRRFRYRGAQRLARRVPARRRCAAPARAAAAVRQLAALPWFARNLVVKAALAARQPWLARAVGHRTGTWPF